MRVNFHASFVSDISVTREVFYGKAFYLCERNVAFHSLPFEVTIHLSQLASNVGCRCIGKPLLT